MLNVEDKIKGLFEQLDTDANQELIESIRHGIDVCFEGRKLPEKYNKGLTSEEKKIMRREVEETSDKPTDKDSTYDEWESDKKYKSRGKKPKKSPHTSKYEKMFGESLMESTDKTLTKKAKETGISKTILKKVFDRGMAAWRTGHRPGVSPHQWAMGRVNSFATGGKTRSTADKDLWEKHKKNKKKK